MSHAAEPEATRRDFIYYATGYAGVVVAGAAVWPLVNQMNASADVKAQASIRIDVSALEPGGQLTVLWQGKPIFIRVRTEEEIAAAREVDPATLPDPEANNDMKANVPATDENRALSEDGVWLVTFAACTHLGCIPLVHEGEYGGWFCPCHGSVYDTSGRIRSGPAPRNLPIPQVAFVDETTIQLGQEEA